MKNLNARTHVTFNSLDALEERLAAPVSPTFKQYDIPLLSETYESKGTEELTLEDSIKIINHTKFYRNEKTDLLEETILSYEESLNNGMTWAGYEHDVAGFLPDIPELLAGSPTNMLNLGDDGSFGVASKPVVRIGINTGLACNCGAYGCLANPVSCEICANRGAAIISMVNYLESKNQRCEVWALFRGHYHMHWSWGDRARNNMSTYTDEDSYNLERFGKTGHREFAFDVKIKNAHEAVNLNTLAFPLLSTAWSRRLMFRLMETYPSLNLMTHRESAWEIQDDPMIWQRYYGIANKATYNQDFKVFDEDEWDIYIDPLWVQDTDSSDSKYHYLTRDSAIGHLAKLSEGACIEPVDEAVILAAEGYEYE